MDGLTAQERELVGAAAAVRGQAYAPYSSFAVGAALRATDGRVFAGCNVENASYGLAVCAERNAVAAAVAQGAREFEALALVTGGDEPAAPCGACRQVLAEFAPDLPVIVSNPEGSAVRRMNLADLLPWRFEL